ncbi:hypothetical protein LENED_009722 [Lentinula edodes]|uniref:Uncharacterized protein n=1 Tax=Lentinula edodes TaxID=5353 RepID=A0A1Q3EKI2_LENED|nr:hypothetical protein LENED_009722 [Lentinula edodes]
MSKRSLPWSGTDEHEYDEDYSPYTSIKRVRLIMQNGRYEDELDLLRSKTKELQARVAELDHEIDEIINLDMDDVVSLKQDVHFYYHQYRRARLEALELREELAKSRTIESNETTGHKPSDELILLRAELAELERQRNSDIRDRGSRGIKEVESAVSNMTNFREASIKGVLNGIIEHKSSDEVIALRAQLESPTNTDVKESPGEIEEEGDASSDIQVFNNNPLSTQSFPQSDDSSALTKGTINAETCKTQTLCYPDDAPSFGWFFDAFDYLNVDLGSQYLTLLRYWVDHERKNQWQCSETGAITATRLMLTKMAVHLQDLLSNYGPGGLAYNRNGDPSLRMEY